MKPSLLKLHFSKNHPDLVSKDQLYFKSKAPDLKRMRYDSKEKLSQENINCLRASYMVSLRIAKSGKPHVIAKTLIMTCCKDIAGCCSEKKLYRN